MEEKINAIYRRINFWKKKAGQQSETVTDKINSRIHEFVQCYMSGSMKMCTILFPITMQKCSLNIMNVPKNLKNLCVEKIFQVIFQTKI